MDAREPAGEVKPTLLIIDDDQELCAMLAEYLGPEGLPHQHGGHRSGRS